MDEVAGKSEEVAPDGEGGAGGVKDEAGEGEPGNAREGGFPAILGWILWALGLFVVYVLSLGPMILIYNWCNMPVWMGNLMEFFYAPLTWLSHRFKWVDQFLEYYLSWL